MGQQESKQPAKKKNWKQQAKVQGLYEMYTQSIRLSKYINQSLNTQSQQSTVKKPHKNLHKKKNYKTNKKAARKNSQSEHKFLKQSLQSFKFKNQFVWSEQIPQLFMKHFSEGFEEKWHQSKEFFYELLLENVGVNVESEELLSKSRIGHNGSMFHKQDSLIIIDSQKNNLNKVHFTRMDKKIKSRGESFEEYFHQIIKQRSSMNIKSSFLVNDDQIDRRKEEEIAQIQSQRMTLYEEINLINSSIIDAETIEQDANEIHKHHKHYENPSQLYQAQHQNSNIQTTNNNNNYNNNNQINDDDEYFLPLITKRHKHKSKNKNQPSQQSLKKLALRISQQSSSYSQHQIEMSHFPSKAKYSRVRLETSSVILPSTIFYDRMNFSAKVQTDQSLKIYRQLSNTIQQTINSCNLISCPLKHFLLYFEYKTSKKKISQLNRPQSKKRLSSTDENIKSNKLAFNKNKSSDYMKDISLSKGSSVNMIYKKDINRSSEIIKQPNQKDIQDNKQEKQEDIYKILIEVSQKSEIIRKKRQFNTNYLLKQVKQFTQAYTEFLYKYLNFDKIEQTDLSTFINLDTVYGIVLRNIWNIVNWIADRGYEWEEYALVQIVDHQNPHFQTFTQQQIQSNPSLIIKKYASFCNKDIKKIKTDPIKLCKTFTALLKLKNQVFPQKYLKKIIIFYRQATKCCQGADDLMTLYEFLLKNCILSNMAEDMHIFRMKNIIDKLIPIESSSIDGAGQIVYAWTTWNIMLQMLNMKLTQYKKTLLDQNEKKTAIYQISKFKTEKKKHNENQQINMIKKSSTIQKQSIPQLQTSSTIQKKHIENANQQNPERKIDQKLQFTLTSCHQIQL